MTMRLLAAALGMALLLMPNPRAAARPAYASLKVGQPAPDFTIRLVGGKKVRLADLKGQVVVLNLWATWCEPCKSEMPGLDLVAINAGSHGLRIFGVVVEDPTPEYGLRNIAKLMHYPIATYISGGYEPIHRAVPTNYIIDRKGVLRYAMATALTPEALARLVVPLINEAP